MTNINTKEDLAPVLRERPTWAEALRAILTTQKLLDLPARFEGIPDFRIPHHRRLTLSIHPGILPEHPFAA